MNSSLRNKPVFYVCATILARNVKDAERFAHDAIGKGADLVEIRLDYLENIVDHINELNIPWSKSIITLRSKPQGGLFNGDELDAVNIMKTLSRLRPCFIDVELDIAHKYPEFLSEIKGLTNIIVSWHDINSTPEFNVLRERALKCVKLGDFGKVVTTARSIGDSIKILKLYKLKNPKYKNRLVAFSMGEQGFFSRVLSLVLGNPIFYVAYREKAAPGQINLEEGLRIAEIIRSEELDKR
ncbi:MAG: hypothetical protein DRJ41_00035 [Thermoprotei archaeon]|nr:MAG: hypothetical protein DRJ41_00035 [Thermoprotei archaeon]